MRKCGGGTTSVQPASVTELRRVVGLNVSGIILTWALLMGGAETTLSPVVEGKTVPVPPLL